MKKLLSVVVIAVLSMSMLLTGCGEKKDSGNTSASSDKEILIVSFGTSYSNSRHVTIGAIEDAIREAYPDYQVRRAFTAQIIIDKLKKEVITGQVEVKQVFKISKVGTVAGGLVTEGKVHSKDKGRVVRDGIVIHTAPIGALKRYKDDVKEVVTGLECGLSLTNYNDIQVGDIIETFTEVEVEQNL